MNNAFEIGDDNDDTSSQPGRTPVKVDPCSPADENHRDTDKLLSLDRKDTFEGSIKKSVTISSDYPRVYDIESNSPSPTSPGSRALPMLNSRQLLVILMGICAAILAFLIVESFSPNPQPQSWSQICTSRDCIVSSNALITGMDDSHCNNWIENNPIPDFTHGISTFSKMMTKNTKILKSILTSDYKPDNSLDATDATLDKTAFTNLQSAYKSCLNRTAIKLRGLAPLKQYLNQFQKDNFPLESTLNPGKLNASKAAIALAASHDIGVFPLFAAFVDVDLHNPDTNVLVIMQTYRDSKFQEYLVRAMTHYIGQVLGNSSAPQKVIRGVVQLETRLAQHFYSEELLYEADPNLTYNPVSLTSLSLKTIDMTAYFQSRMPFYDRLDSTVVADLATKDYYHRLDSIIAETSPDVFELYLIWQQLSDYIEFVETETAIPIDAGGHPEVINKYRQKPFDNYLSQYCMHGADSILGDVMAKAFVKKVFPESSRKAAQDLVSNIKASFADKLESISWLDATTKALAVQKVNSIATKIGYDDSIFNPQFIADKYPFTMDEHLFFENVMMGERNLIRLNLEKIAGPVDRSEWFMTPSTVNAYYNPSWNEIVFPAAILMDPMYNADRPEYMNYGVIGVIIGHEIVHAFDNMGRLFDSAGKLNDWWTKESENAFNSKAQCIVNQYSSYHVTDDEGKQHNVDGLLSNGENIADNGGLSASLKSWKSVANKNINDGQNMMLPGLGNYTHEQLFFLSYGQLWCSNEDSFIQVKRLSDPHSPPKHRVNGPLKNSAEFSKAFKCPANSNMNPKSKCVLW
ncbi:hypothetical protein BDR26DRAFT_868413 [Obelidium mucronatum]|nr:hypothetical protein BDR26DRAFT_868413 [Obelidium mucronatum]